MKKRKNKLESLAVFGQKNAVTLALLTLAILLAVRGFWSGGERLPGGIRIVLNSNLTCKDGAINIFAENKRSNGCNMQLKVCAKEQGLLASCRLKKGERRPYLKLCKDLKPGRYRAKVYVDALDEKTGKVVLSVSKTARINCVLRD